MKETIEHGLIEVITTIKTTIDLDDVHQVSHDVHIESPMERKVALQVAATACGAAEKAIRDRFERISSLKLVVNDEEIPSNT